MENTEDIEFAPKYNEETNLVTMEPEDIAQIVVATLIDVAGIKPSKRFVKEAIRQRGEDADETPDDAAISEMEYIVREALRPQGPFKDFDDYKKTSS